MPFTAKRRILTGAVAAVAAAALAVPAMAGAAGTASTSVSIKAQQGGFFGYVHSSKQSCELNRTVRLFKVHGGFVGSDLAQPNGPDSMWSINTDRSGYFYAKVAPKKGCSGATSRTVRAQS